MNFLNFSWDFFGSGFIITPYILSDFLCVMLLIILLKDIFSASKILRKLEKSEQITKKKRLLIFANNISFWFLIPSEILFLSVLVDWLCVMIQSHKSIEASPYLLFFILLNLPLCYLLYVKIKARVLTSI